MNLNKKWINLTAGTLMLLFIGLIYGWSIFSKFLAVIFVEWEPSQLRLPFTLSIVFFCIGGFVAGNLTKKLTNRTVIYISAIFLFAGFTLLSTMLKETEPGTSIIMLNIFYGVLNGFGVGLSYNAILSAVTPWFPGKTGIASGILLLGFGIGALALASLVTKLVESLGLFRTFFVLGALVAGVLVLGATFIKKPDSATIKKFAKIAEKAGVAKLTENSDNKTAKTTKPLVEKRDFTLKETVTTPTFWLFFLWNVLIGTGGLLVIGGAAQIAEAFGAAAVLGLIVSVFNGIGRPINGTSYDILGRGIAMSINSGIMCLAGAVLFFGAVTQNAVLIFIGLPLMGICYGGSPALLSAGTAGFFGQKHYAQNFGAATFCLVPAALIAQQIVAILQKGSDISYNSTFMAIIVLGLLAAMLNVIVTISAKRQNLE
jgi:OFA family oxalate/formate antiporter-like MFS transporter